MPVEDEGQGLGNLLNCLMKIQAPTGSWPSLRQQRRDILIHVSPRGAVMDPGHLGRTPAIVAPIVYEMGEIGVGVSPGSCPGSAGVRRPAYSALFLSREVGVFQKGCTIGRWRMRPVGAGLEV